MPKGTRTSPVSITGSPDKRPLRPLPWGLTWFIALVFAVTALGSEEAFWRSRGCSPSVADSKGLWAFWRNRVYRDDGRVIALLGTSRMKADICLETFRRRCPDYRVVQLSVFGHKSPIGTLRDLANDQDFSGVVLCDLVAPLLNPAMWDDQQEYYLHGSSFNEQQHAVTLALLQDRLALLEPRLRLPRCLQTWLQHRRLPRPSYRRRAFSRSLELSFSRAADVDALQAQKTDLIRGAYQSESFPTPLALAAAVEQVDAMVAKIRQRGGDVVLLRLPSSGPRLQTEDEFHPRAEYWDRSVAATSAICIHFADMERLGDIACPDGSHLDHSDTARFSDSLIDELRQRGIL